VQAFEFSVFEVNIRFVGGMLACYALTGDLVWIVLTVYCSMYDVRNATVPSVIVHRVKIAECVTQLL